MAEPATAAPRASLSTLDAAAMLVGIVIGIGIFKTPSLVANFVPQRDDTSSACGLLGGFVTFVGALCYAELGSVAAERRRRIPVPERCLRPEGQRAVRLGALQRDPAGRDRGRRLRARRLCQCRAARSGRMDPAIYAVIGVLVGHRHQLRRHHARQVDPARAVAAHGRGGPCCRCRRLHGARHRPRRRHRRGTWSGAWPALPWCSCS